ncbi:MAG: hypothetical protein V7K68_25210 [Nostoc sp.]|uniref:hypothetical protein n=1 Tax=Nostoc sp. TaxID=1180 RepID=UPI002FF85186
MLSQVQLDQINALPKEVQETVRTMLIKAETEKQQALENAKNNSSTIKYRIEPLVYVTQILEKSPGLTSTLELIALAVDYMLPGCLVTAREKHSDVFDKYSGIAFMQVIAATGVARWKSQRDVYDKMANELKTLDPNFIPAKEEQAVEEESNEESMLSNLPIVPPQEQQYAQLEDITRNHLIQERESTDYKLKSRIEHEVNKLERFKIDGDEETKQIYSKILNKIREQFHD